MAAPAPISDSDLLRARADPAFRHKLVQTHLGLLLAALQRQRHAPSGKAGPQQMREGAEMAVRLADILHRIAQDELSAGK